nr:MAG TPA: hypothetical protein [Caudoviricetes sp.]
MSRWSVTVTRAEDSLLTVYAPPLGGFTTLIN